ncbi:unnamed protein product [Auanema sp. JU1783]|nr:unnamed protein product [Auanema sp. JU1783]
MRRVQTGGGRLPAIPGSNHYRNSVLTSPTSKNRPIFYCSESEMPQLIRDKSPRLSAEMRRSRGDKSSSPSPSPNRKKELKKDAKLARSPNEKGCPPALSSGRSGMSDGSMQRTFHEAMRQRRTSLPANSLHIGKVAQPCGSNISEARGMVADMLACKDLPGNVVCCLKAVASLLNPHSALSLNSFNDFGLPSVVEDPFSGEQLIVNSLSYNAQKPFSVNWPHVTWDADYVYIINEFPLRHITIYQSIADYFRKLTPSHILMCEFEYSDRAHMGKRCSPD